MKSKDLKNRDLLREQMQNAIKNSDTDAFYAALDEMIEGIGEDLRASYEQSAMEALSAADSGVLTARGLRQLTSEERDYYNAISDAMRARDPKQALANLDVVMPETVLDSVFDELRTAHPLLSKINFMPSGGAVSMIVNRNGYQTAAWGALCDEIVKELTSGFEEVDTRLLKLSAFLPVCKAMLDLGPAWLDRYVRAVLYEALANGLEVGILTGDGNEKPIGMTRQIGEGVSVVGGAYPEKAKISVTDFSPASVGKLLSLMAMDPNGKARAVNNLFLVVSPSDYFSRVMPATTVMAPDGTYRNNVLPYPIEIVQSPALNEGEAVLGIADRYFAAAGIGKEGRIEFSDHYRFLEDDRVYLIKVYATGMPLDNNAFLHLDISDLAPTLLRVETVSGKTPSADASLSALTIGNLVLSPAFSSSTTTYTATTTAATNKITAVPAHAGAEIEIAVGDDIVLNGTAATWQTGANTVTIKVTAEDGTTTKTYTVTVTK
jgi:phage capsid family|nr:MAG TPA: major capsid protein [Caudoviricetes sp.]